MDGAELAEIIGPALATALEGKGYTRLTPVQEAVLSPALAGRDLRVTSQTGSGKTVAIGFSLAALVKAHAGAGTGASAGKGAAPPPPPTALVVAPTRELAKQVEAELGWLFAPLGARVTSLTGGASYRDERRALASGPAIVVGTPGRLLDHIERGSVQVDQVGAVVLDEADRMLDMGFRDELEAILARTPAERRTHLVSATFPREVRALADRVQHDPAHVEGTPLGAVNLDIDHVMHVVDGRERTDAIVNLLLAYPEEQTLVFARTRADVARITSELDEAGFPVSSLSGEMDQRARNNAMMAFKRGDLRALIATDVAARGIDVQDIARVIHAEPPTDADSYTHRSGRTGRAGRKGTSSVLVTPAAVRRTARLLEQVGVSFRFEPIPAPADIRSATDERAYAELVRDDREGFPGYDPRTWALAERLAQSGDAVRTLARLLMLTSHGGAAEPREITPIAPPTRRDKPLRQYADEPTRPRREPRGGARGRDRDREFVPFRVSWGGNHGADPRRLLALVCRRGGIAGSDVGSIRVEQSFSIVEVARDVADAFTTAARAPDPRDPRVLISPDRGAPARKPYKNAPPRPRAPGTPPHRSAAPAHAHALAKPARPAAKSAHAHAKPARPPAKSAHAHSKPAHAKPAHSKPAHSKPAQAKPSK